MKRYIDADRLKAEVRRQKHELELSIQSQGDYGQSCHILAYENILSLITSLQQEQPIEGKQIIIITETNGDANIHWDCRSLDDVMLLLESAKSYIGDKQNEELRGRGSGPDYNTTEGRFRNAHKFKQERPEVDLEKELDVFYKAVDWSPTDAIEYDTHKDIARHFYELGRNAKKQ